MEIMTRDNSATRSSLRKIEEGWLIAFSEKALTSMEALLLDRYRTHVWKHFHHRVVTMKILVRHLIEKALEQGLITKEQFNPAKKEEFALRDDVWLWNILRGLETSNDATAEMIKRAVLFREKKNVLNLWKGRISYHEMWDKVKKRARVNIIDLGIFELYMGHLKVQMQVPILSFKIPFKAVSERSTFIYSEKRKELTGKSLVDVSHLIENLEPIWKSEPQRFILFVDKDIVASAIQRTQQWIDFTAQWLTS